MYRGYDGAGVSYTELEVLPDFSGIDTLSTAIIGGATRGPLTRTKVTNIRELRKLFGDPIEGDWGLWAAMKVLKNSNCVWYKRIVSANAAYGNGSVAGKSCKWNFVTKDYDEYLNGAKIQVTIEPGSSYNKITIGDSELATIQHGGTAVTPDDPTTVTLTKGAASEAITIPSGKVLVEVQEVKSGTTVYEAGTDYTVASNGAITWVDGGSAPAANAEYTVKFVVGTATSIDGDQIALGAGQTINKVQSVYATVNGITCEYTYGEDVEISPTGVVTWHQRFQPDGVTPVIPLPEVGGAYDVLYTPETTQTIQEPDRYNLQLTKNGTILEKLTGFVLDPTSENYIVTALKERSDYISCVVNETWDASATNAYKDAQGNPILFGTYTITGGNGGYTGLVPDDYIGREGTDEGIQDFSDAEVLDISTLIIPGIFDDKVIFAAGNLAAKRGDIMYIAEMPEGLTPQQADKFARRKGDWTPTGLNKLHQIDNKFVALYYPWVLEYVAEWGKNVYTPPSAWVAAQFAYNDTVAHTWFAPAGFQSGTQGRGVLTSALGLEHNCTSAERDILYADDNGVVNPIVAFVGKGIALWGNKTTLRTSKWAAADSSWTQISVRRLCNYCRKVIIKVSMETLFQPNTETYWKQWRVKVEQELQRIKEGEGIEAYRVQMDRSTISEEDLYYGRAPGKVFIKPIHAIEWIPITFTVTHDNVVFEEGNTSVEE